MGTNLMEHQSGKETVRTDELPTGEVGWLARLLPCRNVRLPGMPTPQRFFYPDWLATAGGLDLHPGVDAEQALRLILKKPLESWQRPRQLPLLANPPARRRRC